MRSLRGTAVRAAVVGCALALADCAGVGPERGSAPVAFAAARPAFELAGRLSLKRGGEALTANFRWQHTPGQDEIDLASPTGQTLARLYGAPGIASLQTADGRVETAVDWNALTARALEWSLPVEGLGFWIQGIPRPGAAFTVEPGAGTEPGVLRQDGWTIVYLAFGQDENGVSRPARMVLSYPDVELRLAVDAWR
ncbi:MAG TPA: lipoprotein insertase outer membrane protein LolB [Casimicrobiaceae bacterium]|nr:lipoprotein insertase outer membrane protein LolB [Casimicrobiaceae bacterium]